MKTTILILLQQRMDKCTNEQFWAVAATTGMNAFLLSQKTTISLCINTTAIFIVLAVVTIYAISFIINRHIGYYQNSNDMQTLLENESDVPDSMKLQLNPWSWKQLSGVVFYISWVVLGAIAVVFCYAKNLEEIVEEIGGHHLTYFSLS
jgi:hypothetical protein